MIRLLVDATSATDRISGLERYTREIVTALSSVVSKRGFLLVVLLPSGASWIRQTPAVQLHRSRFSSRIATEQLWIPWIIRRLNPSIAFFPAFPPSPLVFWSGVPIVKTVHDVVLWRHSKTISWKARAYFRPQETYGIHRYQRIHTVSAASGADISALFPRIASRVVISGNGVDLEHFAAEPAPSRVEATLSRLGLPRRYILAVGTIEPRKNYPFLAGVTQSLIERGDEINLVLAGRPGWGRNQLVDTIERLGLGERVHFAGPVDDDDLHCLYRGALLLAMPSVQEGFGLPIIEAMAAGTPVVASDLPSLKEVAGHAGVLLEVGDHERWVSGMERLIHDEALRKHLIKLGRERAEKFSWPSVATRILDDLAGQLTQ
jgi:glycosyltransferase involved in cell wall biosynthesis